MTNEKRIEAVKGAIDSIKKGKTLCMCTALQVYEFLPISDIFKYFPELLKHKPVNTFSKTVWFHFSDSKSRIDILNKVLTEIQNQEK